ncbi:unnamed protein product [Schistocephalus solidus]|uniref:DUF7083 domain-containing protein n=1 Tax=Schistocephalus solidus TaxID=70667 RepID=A0A3P7F8D6_SCHSO|nr:unnamed protein product [Schistocephalus solidus]
MWYKRYEDLFSVDLAAQDDTWNVRLLLHKLGPAEHKCYANFILPMNPREITFVDTLKTLSQIFGEQSSLLKTRFPCLQLCKRESNDFITRSHFLLNLHGHSNQATPRNAAQASTQGEITAISLSALWCVAFPSGMHILPNRSQSCAQTGHRDGFCQTPSTAGSKSVPTTSNSKRRFRPKRKPKTQSIGNSLSLLATFQLNAADRRNFVDILLDGHAVGLQLDTASDITFIAERLWQSICSFTMQHTSQSATSACGFRPKRPIPYAALPLVDAEMKRLKKLSVLTLSYSTWAAPIVVIKKPNGSISICADFSTGLNAALTPNCYPLLAPAEWWHLLCQVRPGRSYLDIEVAPDARQFLTISTHRGLFQYTRLPFSVKTTPALFQPTMKAILSDIPGMSGYLDDIIIMGRSPSELQDRV